MPIPVFLGGRYTDLQGLPSHNASVMIEFEGQAGVWATLDVVNTRDRASLKLAVPDGADFVPEEDEVRSLGPVFRDEEPQGDRH